VTLVFQHAKLLENSPNNGAANGNATATPKREDIITHCLQLLSLAGDPVLCKLHVYQVPVQLKDCEIKFETGRRVKARLLSLTPALM
jgi:hypothetical protein